MSRKLYTNPKEEVESAIEKWSGSLQGAGDEVGDKFKAECSACQKDTLVPFEPKKGLPVYCKDCLKKIKNGELKPLRGFAGFGEKKKEISKAPLSVLGIEFKEDGTPFTPNIPQKRDNNDHSGKLSSSYDKKMKPNNNGRPQKRGKPSPMLKNLLNKIGLAKDQNSVEKIEDLPIEEVKKDTPQPVSLSSLKKEEDNNKERVEVPKPTKEASQEKLDSLKKVLESSDFSTTNEENIDPRNTDKENTTNSNVGKNQNTEDIMDNTTWKKRTPQKEVPEDVLRKVLE